MCKKHLYLYTFFVDKNKFLYINKIFHLKEISRDAKFVEGGASRMDINQGILGIYYILSPEINCTL